MFIKNWRKEIFTIPNLLSLFRLLLIPVYVVMYLKATEPRQYFAAGAVLALSCLTDAVDGRIARKFNMISNLGKLLDPLADKLTQLTLTVCLSLKYPVLNPVLILLLTKEIFQLIGAVILLRRGGPIPSSMIAGKISTAVLFISLIAMVLFPDMDPRLVNVIAIVDSVCLVYAFITYYVTFFGRPRHAHRSQP